MKTKKTDMQIDGKRAHGTGEAIRKGNEEMRGTERREGKETSWQMERGTMMITKRTETGGEIERKSMKGRGTRKDTEIKGKRGKGTERDAARRTGTKGGKRETRKEGEKNGTESAGPRGREGDTRRVEKEREIG